MRYRCYRCMDRHPNRFGQFHEFEGDRASCPKCGAGEPAVVGLVDVHFLVPDPRGEVQGDSGVRYRVGCDPKRDVLAFHRQDDYAATGDPRAVTCPSCKGLKEWQEGAGRFQEMRQVVQQLRDQPGECC